MQKEWRSILEGMIIECFMKFLESLATRGAFFAIPKYASIDDIPHQGFKLHVSATILNCISVAEKVIPYLMENKIQFKMIKDVDTLIDLNRGWLGYPQN
jgi:hypothetical protein